MKIRFPLPPNPRMLKIAVTSGQPEAEMQSSSFSAIDAYTEEKIPVAISVSPAMVNLSNLPTEFNIFCTRFFQSFQDKND